MRRITVNKHLMRSFLNRLKHRSSHVRPSGYRILSLLISLLVLSAFMLTILGPTIQSVGAQGGDEGDGGRYTTIEIEYTQYTWQLVSREDSQPICRLSVFYEGYPLNKDVFDACQNELSTPEGAKHITSEQMLQDIYWILLSVEQVVRTEKVPLMEMFIDINAPDYAVQKPYITLTAVEPLPEHHIAGIYGLIDGAPFSCAGEICEVQLQNDAEIEYWATSSYGDESRHYTATLRVLEYPPNFITKITTKSAEELSAEDLPSSWSEIAKGDLPQWMYLPKAVAELDTTNDLQYLAGKLIYRGVVDASTCPGGGLFPSLTANACGLNTSKPAVIEWQNMFNPLIWDAAQQTGVPAILIKSMFEYETQYWPESYYRVLGEYGFGQLNELGADVALRWDHDLTARVCASLKVNCAIHYAYMSEDSQAFLRGGLVRLVNADCSNCDYGIDLRQAQESIIVFARILRANGHQTAYILARQSADVSYEDFWKFTMVSYHSGYQILDSTVTYVLGKGLPLTWRNLSAYLPDPSAKIYVDGMWDTMLSYKQQQLEVSPTTEPTPVYAITPTPTPKPKPPGMIDGKVHVVVFIDSNDNKQMDMGEEVNDMDAVVTFADGSSTTQAVVNGRTTIYYTDQRSGSGVQISIPMLYRSVDVELPQDGELVVTFLVHAPSEPVILP